MTEARVFTGNCGVETCASLAAALGRDLVDGVPAEPLSSDLVFLDVGRSDGVAHGNALSACRELKRSRSDCRVLVLLRDDDEVSAGIARFCGADGCVRVDAAGHVCEPDALRSLAADSERPSPPAAARLDRIAESYDEASRQETAIQRFLEQGREDAFLDRLTDAETGLFDGHFATFKLEEELKRAIRFHQPLSLILLDCGGELPTDPTDRRLVLAEVASVFLTECRDIDTLARFTETVFLFLLPGTGADGAERVARRMLEGLSGRSYSAPVRFDPVAGLATVPMPGVRDRAGLIARVETCLAAARNDPAHAGLCALSE